MNQDIAVFTRAGLFLVIGVAFSHDLQDITLVYSSKAVEIMQQELKLFFKNIKVSSETREKRVDGFSRNMIQVDYQGLGC